MDFKLDINSFLKRNIEHLAYVAYKYNLFLT